MTVVSDLRAVVAEMGLDPRVESMKSNCGSLG